MKETGNAAAPFVEGWYSLARRCPSPFFNERPGLPVTVLVIHNISLPPGEFGSGYIEQLFQGCLDCDAHESFSSLRGLEVSAHFLITRQGEVVQFVPLDQRAWHAGISMFNGRSNVNDVSIGIELEGTDSEPYTDAQYGALHRLTKDLMREYPIVPENIVGHCDIAPGRKTDPGPAFDWTRYKDSLGGVA